MADSVTCPACGFPNPEGAHSCISCQSPISRPNPKNAEGGVASRMKPASSSKTAGGVAPAPVTFDDSPATPEEILERIRQVRGEDAMKSLEMLAIPDLKSAVEADLGSTPSPAPASAPESGQAPSDHQAAPTNRSFAAAAEDPWIVDHHELRAIQASDPWRSQFQQYSRTDVASPAKSGSQWAFKPIDVLPAAGVLAVLVSIAMPWFSVHGGVEGQSLSPGSLPMTLLVKGVSDSYPLAWLTATVVMVVLAIVSIIGLALPRNQAAATGLTVAGMMTILIPAAFLVKFAISGETGVADETAYVAAPGLYVAIGAALLLLLGAALRGSKSRS
jgi:hypothetical protein